MRVFCCGCGVQSPEQDEPSIFCPVCCHDEKLRYHAEKCMGVKNEDVQHNKPESLSFYKHCFIAAIQGSLSNNGRKISQREHILYAHEIAYKSEQFCGDNGGFDEDDEE